MARMGTKLVISAASIVLLGWGNSLAQCTTPSSKAPFASYGANELVVLTPLHKLRNLEGVLATGYDEAAVLNGIVDVYRVKKYLKNTSAADAVQNAQPLGSYYADQQGIFCVSEIEDGIYVLRAGTDTVGFKHVYFWIQKSKRHKKRAVEIELYPGT